MTDRQPVVRPVPAALAVVMLLALLIVVAWPNAWAINRAVVRLYYLGHQAGVPRVVTPDHWAAALNVALFVPATALVLLALPRLRWWWVLGTAILGSVAIEVAQGMGSTREGSLSDVVTNTLGAAIGCLLVVQGRTRRRRGTSESPGEA